MGERYFANDLRLMVAALEKMTTRMEGVAGRLLNIGLNISGFDGETAEAVKSRYTVHYLALKEEQERCNQEAFRALSSCLDMFLEIDHGDAVIYKSRLEDNTAFISGIATDLAGEIDAYNQILNSIAHIGVGTVRLSTEPIEYLQEDSFNFNRDLIRRLEDADRWATIALKQCSENYAILIMHLLDMFDSSVQLQLIKMMDGKISPSSLKFIKENLEVENERRRLLLYLETDKEAIMAELGIETDEAYAAYVKSVLTTWELCKEYEDAVEAYESLSVKEKMDSHIADMPTPFQELLFLIQLDGIDVEKRKKLLGVLKENTSITEAEISRILGIEADSNLLFGINATYNASRYNQSYTELMMEGRQYDLTKKTQSLMMILTPYIMQNHRNKVNPPVSQVSLDMNIRLDRMELDAQKGFGSFDYVPLSWESIKRGAKIAPGPGDSTFIGPVKGTSGAGGDFGGFLPEEYYSGDYTIKPSLTKDSEGNMKLYRTVSEAEYKSLMEGKPFDSVDGSMESKWLSTSIDDAKSWGDKMDFGGDYKIVEISIPESVVDDMYYGGPKLDGIGPAFNSSSDVLNEYLQTIRPVN